MDQQDWQILTSTPLFGGLPDSEVRTLVGNHGPRVYEKGVLLFQQGDPATDFYVVLSGWVKVSRTTADGNEAVVGVFTRGDTFAEAAMFLGGRYPAGAEVIVRSRLLKINGTVVRSRIHEQPDLALAMLASASKHLKLLVDQLEDIKLRSAPQRIAEFLIDLEPLENGDGFVVSLPYEKAFLANRLGMKPESFSRSLAKLRGLGVSVNRDVISIVDIDALTRYAETGELAPQGDDGS